MSDTIEFFRDIFADSEGYLCIAWPDGDGFKHRFYQFPGDVARAVEVADNVAKVTDAYFGAHLFAKARRKKEFTVPLIRTAWADLDACHPSHIKTKPTYVVETSPDRYHAYWKLDKAYPAEEVELLNHQIAVANREHGCDQNGWALAKLMRVPGTLNYKTKYLLDYGYRPAVKLVDL